MARSETTPANVRAILAIAQEKIDRLRGIAPYLIDFQQVIERMIRLMRRDLRTGKRIVYDEHENLLDLHARACAWFGTRCNQQQSLSNSVARRIPK